MESSQLTSLRSPLLNGLINVFSIIINDKKQVQQKFNILANLILWLQFWVGMFAGWKWQFILYTNLLAEFNQAGKLDSLGAFTEQFNYTKFV